MTEKCCVKGRLMASFNDIYELLLSEGYSAQEALERMFVIFDWEVRGVRRVIDFREDEFAETEKQRMKAAEEGADFAAVWIEAASRGDGSEKFIERLAGITDPD